jgi:hypothetical protein
MQPMGFAIFALFLLAAPPAAAHGGDTSVIHACVHRSSGNLRIVAPGESCRPPESSLHWSAQAAASSGGGPRGVQLFESSGSFTVPAGVTSVLLELWGAGGAAGLPRPTGIGGAGGGGSYLRTVVSVTPGQMIAVGIGLGGAATCGIAGGDGGDTTFGALATAGGGQGGATAEGAAGAGGVADPGGISQPGSIGFATGGFSSQGSFAVLTRRAPGRGGMSFTACTDSGPLDAAVGAPGQLIVQW